MRGAAAIVTGGASGIGRAATLTFLREGARVVIGDLNEASIAETAALAEAQGHADRVASLRADVSAERDVAGLVELAPPRPANARGVSRTRRGSGHAASP